MASSNDEVVALELPAPTGWKKKFLEKEDDTPKKSKIVFVAPTGDDIMNRKQLEQYLNAHPGGPKLSDFDWGSGESPRRSTRISEKGKSNSPAFEIESPKKRVRKSSSLKKDKTEDEELPEPITDIEVEMKEDEEAEKEVEEKDGNAPDDTEGKEKGDTEKDSVDDKKDGIKTDEVCKIPHVPLSDDGKEVHENNQGELIHEAEQMSKTEAEKDGAVEGHKGNFKCFSEKNVEAKGEGAVENGCHVEGLGVVC
ncbi:uncharacterized protein [Rutidosis leptorrhynchoides]|uniref:uncharacterized protein n=1 Tax=Rutidosis leptorrhynchoides TaxID=125765 RepID=UPI003A9A48F3